VSSHPALLSCRRIRGIFVNEPRGQQPTAASRISSHGRPRAAEREILAQLIRAVQTVSQQTLTVHLQLGAVRAILARKAMATVTELEPLSAS
jgi:hypothetical protein